MVVVFKSVHRDTGIPFKQGFAHVVGAAVGLFCRGIAEALHIRPSVVAAGFDQVELIRIGLSVFALVYQTVGADAQTLPVAVTIAPHITSRIRVVFGDRSVEIDPKCFPFSALRFWLLVPPSPLSPVVIISF
jgi:hypothetical protein